MIYQMVALTFADLWTTLQLWKSPAAPVSQNTVCIMYKVNYNDQMLLYSCKLLIHEELVTLNYIVFDAEKGR